MPIRRVLLAAAIVVFAGAWAVAIWYSVTRDSPERLEGDAHDRLAGACDDALAALRALPPLGRDSDARDAVALTRAENDVFRELVGRLRAIDADGDRGAALDEWADDWETVVGRRARYADELAATGEGRFESPLETVLRMEQYAIQQGLDHCNPETLQADVVDTPRAYPEE